MSSLIKDYTTNELKEAILSGSFILIDVWAPWCGPCKIQAPILEKVATKVGNRIKIGKVNVELQEDISNLIDVQSIPTLIFFHKGKAVEKLVGLQHEHNILSKIEELEEDVL